jgi:GPH family glycoside/pentoside/hexuronide:cation symporter
MKVSIREKIGYGLGDTASNFIWALMMNFIMFFYTDIFGITAAAAGTMLLFARCTDGIVDFFIGAAADRTHSRWGKFRPYLLWLCLPLAVVFVLAFTTPNFSSWGKLVWAWTTYNLLMLLYSAINIPYGALSGVMTDDPLERTSVNSFRMVLAQIGGIVANSSFLLLIKAFGGENQQLGAQRTVILFSAISIVFFLVSFFSTRERIHPPVAQKTKLVGDIKTLLANRHWLMMFAAGIINITFAVVRGTAGVYYLKSYLKWDDKQIATYFLVGGLAMIFGAMLTKFSVRSIGKKYSFIISMALVALTAIPFYWIKPHETELIFTFQILGMIFAGINATLYWALVADTADYAEWKFNVRTTGIIFSATTSSQKAGMGIGAAFAGWLLSYFGYVANAEQTTASLHGILLLSSLIPAAGLLMLSIFFLRYGLDEATCKVMRMDLAARRI